MDDTQTNEKRFIYFYFNRFDPDKIKRVVPTHVEYWKTAGLKEYQGGPFGDRSGGLISFSAPSLEEATAIVLQDPFIKEELIDQKWIKEWVPE